MRITESERRVVLRMAGGMAIGVCAGVLISYWFQPGALRLAVSLPDYLGQTVPMFFTASTYGPTLRATTLAGLFVGGLAGGTIFSKGTK
jgi:hypothetical protein